MFQVICNFFSGTCLLIFGFNILCKSLENAYVKHIKKILATLTNNLYLSFLVGIIITSIVQSSTAVTLITVSFVDSGLMKLTQAIGVIYGANIGTTVTAQLMSINLLDYAPLIFSIGFIISSFAKKNPTKAIGKSITGLGFVFFGIKFLQASIPYIKSNEEFFEIFQIYGSNPLIGIIVGAITTMLIHSSSATVGFTIVLFNENLINFNSAIGLILGDNIGTCVTAQIASLAGNIHARRTAWAHTLYNVIGVLAVVLLFYPFKNLVEYITFNLLKQDSTKLVANTHTVFNILSALAFLPITKYYVKFLEWLIPDKSN